MTRHELSAFLQTWFCGCGEPRGACGQLLRLLTMWHGRTFHPEIAEAKVDLLLLHTLNYFDLAQHGSDVRTGWLTDNGLAVLHALEREAEDDFAALCSERCDHGYAVDMPELVECPECGPMKA